MITGAVVTIVWGMTSLGDLIYEIVPGFAAAAIVTWVVSLATAAPRPETTAEFDAAQELIAKANRDKNFQFEGAAD